MDSVDHDRFMKTQRIDRRSAANTLTQEEFAWRGAEIPIAARPRMIGMGMRHDGPRYASPGVDVKITLAAVQP